MEQKRKVKSLISITETPELGFFSKFLIALSFLFCFGALSLTIFSMSFVKAVDNYMGLDEKKEVLYRLDFVKENDLNNIISTMMVDDQGDVDKLYITPVPVVITKGSALLNNVVGKYIDGNYVNLLGGDNLKIESDNISVIGGTDLSLSGGKDNATILGGKGNSIESGSSGIPNVVVGGENNTIKGNNAVILGGKGNKIEGNNSFILGGESNLISEAVSNVIVAGQNVTGNKNNVFVYSNDNDPFTPEKGNAFYINVQEGLGINMNVSSKTKKKSANGVTVSGAVRFGELKSCDSDDDSGLIGLKDNFLVGCGKRKINKIGNSDDSQPPVESFSGYCTGLDYSKIFGNVERYKICASIDNYKNVVFETKLLTGVGNVCDTIQAGRNPCVFVCASGYHYFQGSGTCNQDCEIPWSGGEYKKHGELISGYTDNTVVCNLGSTCGEKYAELECDDGKWKKKSGDGPNVQYTTDGVINYQYKDCSNESNESCNKEEYEYVGRITRYWHDSGSCTDYSVNENGTCSSTEYHNGRCFKNHTLIGDKCKLTGGGTTQCKCVPNSNTGECLASSLPQNAIKLMTGFKQTATGDNGEWYPKSKNYVYYDKNAPKKGECTYKCDTGYLYSTGNVSLNVFTGCRSGCKIPWNTYEIVNHGTVITGYLFKHSENFGCHDNYGWTYVNMICGTGGMRNEYRKYIGETNINYPIYNVNGVVIFKYKTCK